MWQRAVQGKGRMHPIIEKQLRKHDFDRMKGNARDKWWLLYNTIHLVIRGKNAVGFDAAMAAAMAGGMAKMINAATYEIRLRMT